MSEDQPVHVEGFSGDPSGWPAVLRDLLRHVQEDSPAETELRAWLLENAGTSDDEEAAACVAFLDTVGIVEDTGDGYRPDTCGREYLDTHDEAVLYSGLVSGFEAFERVLDSMAVRPLTDVEIMDLVAVETDADIDSPAVVRPYREWLQAVGYVTHDDGINELTRRGRRIADVDNLEVPEPGAPVSDSNTGDGQGPTASSDASNTTQPAGSPTASREDTDSGNDSKTDEATGPDSNFAAGLKADYDDTCMVCGDRRRRTPTEGFSRVYHLMPTDSSHDGPETAANAVVVCPNHRADFEHGLLTVDPQTLEITHAYESDLSGRRLQCADGHDLGAQYLAYHNQVVAEDFE